MSERDFVKNETKTPQKAGPEVRVSFLTAAALPQTDAEKTATPTEIPLKRSAPGVSVQEKTAQETGTYRSFRLKEGESLLDGLIRNQFSLSAPCGGLGRCGKCRVQILSGCPIATPQDQKVFSPAELEGGWRLACRVFPREDIEILLPENMDKDFEVLSTNMAENAPCTGSREALEKHFPEESRKDIQEKAVPKSRTNETEYNVAVDVGTTTIAMVLLEAGSHTPLHTVTGINSQRKYGADVISRIQASVDGKGSVLQECIRQDLLAGLDRLIQEAGIAPSQISRMVIGGNTTMGHLLMGYSCEKLGVYPFVPVNIDWIEGCFPEILGTCPYEGQVLLLPGISAFVGGDIVSGLYATDFDQREEICLLIDLGTNGEMALGNREKILVTSTAAGPAFEGGNITWGTGSVAGAICSVKVKEEKAQIATIRNMPPTGICGTGVVETVAELVREEIVDDTGALQEEYFEEGFPLALAPDGRKIVFTQQDVREIQLAKAAIRAGIETLLLRYGIGMEKVEKVYLAGGFGHKLAPEAAVSIGMLPRELSDKIQAIGNSSLEGAMAYLQDPKARERIASLLHVSQEIGLAADKDFQRIYMDAMFFEEE